MKRSLIVLFSALVAVVFSSCSDFMQGHYTPEVHCGYPVLNPYYVLDTLLFEDSLSVSYSDALSCYSLDDTVQVGDSALMAVAFYAVINNLVATSATWDSTYMDVVFQVGDSVKKALDLTTTDIDKCYLTYQTGFNYASFPVLFRFKKAGTPKVSLKIESDSKYSPNGLTIAFPIKQ